MPRELRWVEEGDWRISYFQGIWSKFIKELYPDIDDVWISPKALWELFSYEIGVWDYTEGGEIEALKEVSLEAICFIKLSQSYAFANDFGSILKSCINDYIAIVKSL